VVRSVRSSVCLPFPPSLRFPCPPSPPFPCLRKRRSVFALLSPHSIEITATNSRRFSETFENPLGPTLATRFGHGCLCQRLQPHHGIHSQRGDRGARRPGRRHAGVFVPPVSRVRVGNERTALRTATRGAAALQKSDTQPVLPHRPDRRRCGRRRS